MEMEPLRGRQRGERLVYRVGWTDWGGGRKAGNQGGESE